MQTENRLVVAGRRVTADVLKLDKGGSAAWL